MEKHRIACNASWNSTTSSVVRPWKVPLSWVVPVTACLSQSDRLSSSLAGTLIPASFHSKPKWISLTAIADLFLREVVVGQWFWTLCDSDVSLFLLLLQHIFDATTPFWMSSWTSPYSFWPLFNEASVVPVLLKQWFSILRVYLPWSS